MLRIAVVMENVTMENANVMIHILASIANSSVVKMIAVEVESATKSRILMDLSILHVSALLATVQMIAP